MLVLLLSFSLIGLTLACGAASQSTGSASNSAAALTLTPSSATVASQEQLQFTANVSGTSNTAVNWSASAGTISNTGFFTAPSVATNTPVIITATSVAFTTTTSHTIDVGSKGRPANVANAGSRASATVTVTPPKAALAIGTSAIPAAEASMPYSVSLSVTGGGTPYQWSLVNGTLPSGIQLQASSGTITGTTAVSGSFPFTAKVIDASGSSATAAFVLTVSPALANRFDGPAELPLIYIQTAMSNTPAPGSTITVNSGGNLQSALNSASCGDTIQLQAGATFSGVFTFPALNCDDNHWIIVRTSADDSLLPAEGSRLTPCYAGVASLPGRPAFQCPSTNNVVAKLLLTSGDNGPIVFATGANHYRLIGLEVTRLARTGIVYALASVTGSGAANNLIFDRVWLHGTAQDETTRGVDLGGSTYTSIIDSFFTDFHCISLTGSCTDAQAINGGLGDDQIGPYKIVDNFLEASGENILFGGGGATATPADIQISHNHMFKPLTWMKGQPGYVGGTNGNPFIVKNLLELKNAQRVLIDGNIMEDSWGGFSQVGFAMLLTPVNQSGHCPTCLVTDVTIRYNSISHVAAGLQIANALTGTAGQGQRYSIHDIVIDDINGVLYNGPGEFAQVSISPGKPVLQDVTINHITAFPPRTMFFIGTLPTVQMKNFVFTNSIVNAGIYPVWSTGDEGTAANCAAQDSPLITFDACFSPYTFAANAIIDTPSLAAPATWPSGNFFPATEAAVQFVNYNGGNGGNYQLQSSSPYKGKGTDGMDLGADVAAIDAATAGVE
ncbi:MAG TPA: Ig domain-containing protein [Candidatus Eremiobacteraceae bacterium]|nr:Ig domain-containing protein [Candidatus Eremiobacteraceae bacterium]